MLDQLIESKSDTRAQANRGGFLLVTGIIMATALSGAWTFSLFAHDFGMNHGDLEFSSLTVPIPVAENPPEPPKPIQKDSQPAMQKAESEITFRHTNTQSLDETPVKIPVISVVRNTEKARPEGYIKISPGTETEASSGGGANERGGSGDGKETGIFAKLPSAETQETAPSMPPVIKPVTPKTSPATQPASDKIKSLGVVNGRAISLPKPPFPAPAVAVHASGAVNVQVTIDEAGKVVAARAVSGHPLLRQAAESAARGAKFSPTLLGKQAVKVSGVIVYNFIAP